MGDPVTMAVVGGSVGAMMNKKDPLKGAMLGAIGGYGGGALMGAGSGLGASSAIAAAPTSAGAGLMPGAVGAFGQAVPAIVPTTTGAMTTAMGAGGNVASLGAQEFAPSFMDSAKIGLGNIGQYAQQNPVLSQMAMQTGQSLLQQPPSLPPAGLMRGSPSQVQMPQYQVGIPKVSLI
jgi:hypothetical protein